MFKAIIFDLDDTLLWDEKSIEVSLQNTAQYASEKKNISKKHFYNKIRTIAPELYKTYSTFPFTQNIGINPFEGLWGKFDDKHEGFSEYQKNIKDYQLKVWINTLNSFDIEDKTFAKELQAYFINERKSNPFLYEETIDVLDHLKEKYTLALLTNGAVSLQTKKLRLTPELKPYFKKIVISGEYGVGKPNPNIFYHLLDSLQINASEACMIGDNLYTDILGANKVNMTSIWINHKNEKLNDVKPTYEVKRLKDILEILT